MTPYDRKRVAIIIKYVDESFSEGDWYSLGQLTGELSKITDHPRLFRAMSFGDEDYSYCAAEVLDSIFSSNPEAITEVVDHFDIDLWYQQKNPDKYEKIFGHFAAMRSADFWVEGYLRVFVSHLSTNRARMSALKSALANWGVSAFIAHEDIQASREWRDEVEAGLETMDLLVAMVEPGFKESDWCAQEVGYALGRRVDIIPLKADMDPFGFFGKLQAVQIKGKVPEQVACDIMQVLLKKPHHRDKAISSMTRAFAKLSSEKKIKLIARLDEWSILTDAQLKNILEQASISTFERQSLRNLINRIGAFKAETALQQDFDEDIPF